MRLTITLAALCIAYPAHAFDLEYPEHFDRERMRPFAKAWKAMTAFEHGQKFMDLNNADTIEYQCGPSNVPRFGGSVENMASKFLPITDYTCRISAQPCPVPVQKDYGGK